MAVRSTFAVLLSLVATAAGLTYRGVDWSSTKVEENAGISYKTTSGTAQALEKILSSSGVNTVRQRIWVNPSDGNYNLAYNIALAKRAQAAGLGIYLDLHLSDTWADPGHQSIPSGWPSDIDNLAWKLYNYTLDLGTQFQNNGIQPKIVSLGNEITAGLLFPTGKTSSFANVARLLHSASSGIKDSTLNPKPKLMVHLDKGWDWSTQQWFYKGVLGPGTFTTSDFDIMGVSYYPFYGSGATLSALKTSLTNMASTWGKEIIVAETNWPTSCPSPSQSFPSDLKSIPFSAAGQTTFLKNLASVVSGVSQGTGIFYWEPAWVQNANLGSSCANNLMFSSSGQALSSLATFSSL